MGPPPPLSSPLTPQALMLGKIRNRVLEVRATNHKRYRFDLVVSPVRSRCSPLPVPQFFVFNGQNRCRGRSRKNGFGGTNWVFTPNPLTPPPLRAKIGQKTKIFKSVVRGPSAPPMHPLCVLTAQEPCFSPKEPPKPPPGVSRGMGTPIAPTPRKTLTLTLNC